jgi:uncharacterized peroxidase-related enzyme
MQMMMVTPERSKIMLDYTRAVMRGDSAFTPATREMMFAYGSRLNACNYCYGSHEAGAIELGIDEGLFVGLQEDIETSSLDQKLKPVFRLVRKLTLTPSRVIQSDIDDCLEAGWDESAILDAVTVCALHNFMNRLVDGTGVALSVEDLKAAGSKIAHGGYRVPAPPK